MIFDRRGMKCHPGEAAQLCFRIALREHDASWMDAALRIAASAYGSWQLHAAKWGSP